MLSHILRYGYQYGIQTMLISPGAVFSKIQPVGFINFSLDLEGVPH